MTNADKPFVTLNGKVFAPSADAMIDTLFTGNKTADGYYRANKNSITLFAPNGERIGGINAHSVLHATCKLESGRYWHTLADLKIVGPYASTRQRREEVESAEDAVFGPMFMGVRYPGKTQAEVYAMLA